MDLYSNNNPQEYNLEHYGVLGMKWGIRKAREAENDINHYRRNKALRSARKARDRGEISNEEYKKKKQAINDNRKRISNEIKNKYKDLKPVKGASVKSLYMKQRQAAAREIPHYTAKRRIRSIVRGVNAGLMATNVAGAGALAALSYTVPRKVADQMLYLGAGYLANNGLRFADIKLNELAINKTMHFGEQFDDNNKKK